MLTIAAIRWRPVHESTRQGQTNLTVRNIVERDVLFDEIARR
jgi:hypothetical protein